MPTTYTSRQRPGWWTLTLTARGKARITFADGSTVSLVNQVSAARALRLAWRHYRKERSLR